MKKFLVIVLSLISLSPLLAQTTASNWGTQIPFGTTFTKTDSVKLRESDFRTTVMADTIYSSVLYINDWSEGILTIDAWLTNDGGTTDSVCLDYRRATTFKNEVTNNKTTRFGQWQRVLTTMISDTLYSIGIAQADSTWWKAGNGRQYRLYDISVSTDTTTHQVTDFLR